jgi:hypothetical protein
VLVLRLGLLAGCTGESGGGQSEQSEQTDTFTDAFTVVAPRNVVEQIDLGEEGLSVGDLYVFSPGRFTTSPRAASWAASTVSARQRIFQGPAQRRGGCARRALPSSRSTRGPKSARKASVVSKPRTRYSRWHVAPMTIGTRAAKQPSNFKEVMTGEFYGESAQKDAQGGAAAVRPRPI